MPNALDLEVAVSDRDHHQGDAAAPITLVEYGDFECPYCGAAFAVLQGVQRRMGAGLRFVFRHFPLTEIHPNAELAAEAAEAAGAQGKFWEMHDALYERQSELGPDLIHVLARDLNLDGARFFQDIEQRRFLPRVTSDFRGGMKSGVVGIPGFFINGRFYQGSWAAGPLMAALELESAQRKAG